MCSRLVIKAGSPEALYDLHISQVLSKYADLTGHPEVKRWPFNGFRRMETLKAEMAGKELKRTSFVLTNAGEPVRVRVPVTRFAEKGSSGLVYINKPGMVTFVLIKNKSPLGAGWYMVTEAAGPEVPFDRFMHHRQPWIRNER